MQHYDESWWREVTRLFVGLGNPNYFDDFMRAVAQAGKLAGHESFTAECIRDALLPSAEPFIEAATAKPGGSGAFVACVSRYSVALSRGFRRSDMRRFWRSVRCRRPKRAGLRTELRLPPNRDAVVRRAARELLVASGQYGAGALAAGVDPNTGWPRVRINPVDGRSCC